MNKIIFGEKCSALGACGITNGQIVKGIICKRDGFGVYLKSKRGIIHLCNPNTINYE